MGANVETDEGVVGVVTLVTLVTDECVECPNLDSERLVWVIGPPLSETGSSEDCVCVRSWLTTGGPIGRGRRDPTVVLLVNLRATAVLGRDGLAGLVSLT